MPQGVEMKAPRIVIAGERSGVGKSTITVGILLALKKRGLDPQPFKAGPDFLDPMHHSIILERTSRNLDTWMFPDAVKELFIRSAEDAGISVIEGVMGFYDGVDGIREDGSTSHLSKILDSPVILILDAKGSARSIGAIAKGFLEFDKNVNIAGIIFNNIGSEKHLRMLEQSLPKGMVSLGGLPRKEGIELKSRHLGLIPAGEVFRTDKYDMILDFIEENLDVEKIIDIADSAPDIDVVEKRIFGEGGTRASIGVAYDNAFNFYYQDNIDMLESYGAEILYFSPLKDEIPDVDGIYLGGGYPEIFSKDLSMNRALLHDVRKLSEDGMPIYAECGGMMYLCDNVRDMEGNLNKMCGVFKAGVEMTNKLQALSYVEAISKRDNILSCKGHTFRGHEFHYSRLYEIEHDEFAYDLKYGRGIVNGKDGMLSQNTLASYTHVHFAASPPMARELVKRCSIYSRS